MKFHVLAITLAILLATTIDVISQPKPSNTIPENSATVSLLTAGGALSIRLVIQGAAHLFQQGANAKARGLFYLVPGSVLGATTTYLGIYLALPTKNRR